MRKVNVGDRVAVLDGDGRAFLGYGTYDGLFYNERLAELCAIGAENLGKHELAAEIRSQQTRYGKNPRITLEDGTIVWGCEVWWGSAEDYDRRMKEIEDAMAAEAKEKAGA